MNDFVYKLPPVKESEVKCELKDLSGYLEIEVTLIDFIIPLNSVTKLVNNKENFVGTQETNVKTYDTPLRINNINKNNSSVNENCQELKNLCSIDSKVEKGICNTKTYTAAAKVEEINNIPLQVKIVWSGERIEDAAHINISCKTQQQQEQSQTVYNKKSKTKRKYSEKNINRPQNHILHNQKHKQHFKRPQLLLSANNKLRYRIYTSATLFLEYLRFCKPLHILIVTQETTTTKADSCCLPAQYLGQAKYHLPSLLLKKFKHNIVKGQNFVYKTKVFPFYQHNPKVTSANSSKKSGVIQLRFNMLFAPTAAASATAVAGSQHGQVVMHEKQHHHLHNNHCHHAHHHHHQHNHRHHHHHNLVGKSGNNVVVSEDVQGRFFNIDFYKYFIL